jgi:hypothetical protein
MHVECQAEVNKIVKRIVNLLKRYPRHSLFRRLRGVHTFSTYKEWHEYSTLLIQQLALLPCPKHPFVFEISEILRSLQQVLLAIAPEKPLQAIPRDLLDLGLYSLQIEEIEEVSRHEKSCSLS